MKTLLLAVILFGAELTTIFVIHAVCTDQVPSFSEIAQLLHALEDSQ